MKKVIIVEDEIDICNDLLLMLAKYSDLKLVGIGTNVEDSIKLISEKKPDIVLMDIHLGSRTSFEILNAFDKVFFHIIFITAYSEHAIKAIKYGALDYLLKPIDDQDLNEALEKVKVISELDSLPQALKISQMYWERRLKSEKQKIVLRTQQTVHIVNLEDILYCQSEGCYTTFYLKNAKPVIVSKPIKTYEDLLPEESFLRPHQSFLINRLFVKEYRRSGVLLLTNDVEIPVSVRKREKVLGYFHNNKFRDA